MNIVPVLLVLIKIKHQMLRKEQRKNKRHPRFNQSCVIVMMMMTTMMMMAMINQMLQMERRDSRFLRRSCLIRESTRASRIEVEQFFRVKTVNFGRRVEGKKGDHFGWCL